MIKSPRFLLTFGVILMIAGVILPFLMVIRVIASTFFLNFFSWGMSSLGLSLGVVGFTLHSKSLDNE